jgi:hypothetical protein
MSTLYLPSNIGITFSGLNKTIFMNLQENEQGTNSSNQAQNSGQSPSNPEAGIQKIAANPNPRANENIGQGPFEPVTKSEDPADEVGTEITDGEDA